MSRSTLALLFLSLILASCSQRQEVPESVTVRPSPIAGMTISAPMDSTAEKPGQPSATSSPDPSILMTVNSTTLAPPSTYDCGYQWSYQELPELSYDFQESVQRLQRSAQARAYAFGEMCQHTSGTSTFIPMETDFEITLSVSDINNEALLGEWIVNVMKVIENIPTDQIFGPRPGLVTIMFQSVDNESIVRFYIDEYRLYSPGLTPRQIYITLMRP